MGGEHHARGTAAGRHRSRLTVVLVLTTTYLLAEVAGGLWTGSLALLADAGHMLTDVGGLVLALLAIRFAERPASPQRTYGYYRVEILAALVNAIALIGISAYVLYEAYERLRSPPRVESGVMLAVALVGLGVNLVGILLLRRAAGTSLNMKGAYFEVLSDLLTSVGVIIGGLVMEFTGWYAADPLISAGIGLFILPRTWLLLKDAVGVLLEGTPSDVNLASVRQAIMAVPGVGDHHDLHVWSLTSGVNAMSVHVVLADGADHSEVRRQVLERVTAGFPIHHLTIQVEVAGKDVCEAHL